MGSLATNSNGIPHRVIVCRDEDFQRRGGRKPDNVFIEGDFDHNGNVIVKSKVSQQQINYLGLEEL